MPTRAKASEAKASHRPATRSSTQVTQPRRSNSASFPTQVAIDALGHDKLHDPEPAQKRTLKTARAKKTRAGISKTKKTKPEHWSKAPTRLASESHHADDEQAPDGRRFSQVYGHGHLLDEEEPDVHIPISSTSSLSKKRSASTFAGTPSPLKKVRFDSDSNETMQAQEDQTMSIPISPVESSDSADFYIPPYAEDEPIYDTTPPSDPIDHLANQLMWEPQPLTLDLISSLFIYMHKETEDLARQYFTRSDKHTRGAYFPTAETFPLHDLQHKYPALYHATLRLLDASTTDGINHGWLKFFADGAYRPYLVYAILGEWFTQRIFKDPAFGLSPDAREEFEEGVDKKYMYYDTFVRVKQRAEKIKTWIDTDDSRKFALSGAANVLADELLEVLAPIVPTFDPAQIWDQTSYTTSLRHSLRELIEKVGGLNQSIIRSGVDGTFVRVAGAVENGREWSSLAPMVPVNPEVVDAGLEDGANEKLVVKMTCWGRVEAFVPHGMDMVEMADLQQGIIQTETAKNIDTFLAMLKDQGLEGHKEDYEAIHEKVCSDVYAGLCWDCRPEGKQNWDVYPEELWDRAREEEEKEESRTRQYDMREKLARRTARSAKAGTTAKGNGDAGSIPDSSDSDSSLEDVSSSSSSPSSSSSSSSFSSSSDSSIPTVDHLRRHSEPPRGSWVTYYTTLTPHVVYLERAKPLPAIENELRAAGVDLGGRRIRDYNSLMSAVRTARRDRMWRSGSTGDTIRLGYEDTRLRLWNFYARYNLSIEWGAFVAAMIILSMGKGDIVRGFEKTIDSVFDLVSSFSGILTIVAERTMAFGNAVNEQVCFLVHEAVRKLLGLHLPDLEVERLMEGIRETVQGGRDDLRNGYESVVRALLHILPQPEQVAASTPESPAAAVPEATPVLPAMTTVTATTTGLMAVWGGLVSQFLHGQTAVEPSTNTGPAITLPQVIPTVTAAFEEAPSATTTSKSKRWFKEGALDTHFVADSITDDFPLALSNPDDEDTLPKTRQSNPFSLRDKVKTFFSIAASNARGLKSNVVSKASSRASIIGSQASSGASILESEIKDIASLASSSLHSFESARSADASSLLSEAYESIISKAAKESASITAAVHKATSEMKRAAGVPTVTKTVTKTKTERFVSPKTDDAETDEIGGSTTSLTMEAGGAARTVGVSDQNGQAGRSGKRTTWAKLVFGE
ncbi:hypothetical protein LTR05_007912 [Lithohypha guttulata]|uniref:Uncharacterized protein n=1 Tax=Lithohypha guttulata TaxID=1690604 RepID=A0AAN7SUH0_9EURO|nr:hypothetical protein LTR05_007912 [Lithohypha guttulata]